MTTADGTAARAEEQPDGCDEAGRVPLVSDSDTRAIPVMGPPSTLELSPSLEKSSRPDMFDTVVLPIVPPRPLPAPMARRESQRPVRAGTAHDRRGDNRRVSAPIALRVTVVVLFILLLASSGALVALRASPSAFNSLRQTYVIPSQGQPATTHTSVPTTGTHAALVSTTSSAVTYSVPISSYSIVITITSCARQRAAPRRWWRKRSNRYFHPSPSRYTAAPPSLFMPEHHLLRS
jgi:hypothetical protein